MPAQSKPSPTKAPVKKRTTTSRARSRKPPRHDAIAERAYFIHLEEGSSDELGNWLRAERELRAA